MRELLINGLAISEIAFYTFLAILILKLTFTKSKKKDYFFYAMFSAAGTTYTASAAYPHASTTASDLKNWLEVEKQRLAKDHSIKSTQFIEVLEVKVIRI
jgi:hypothetical protein